MDRPYVLKISLEWEFPHEMPASDTQHQMEGVRDHVQNDVAHKSRLPVAMLLNVATPCSVTLSGCHISFQSTKLWAVRLICHLVDCLSKHGSVVTSSRNLSVFLSTPPHPTCPTVCRRAGTETTVSRHVWHHTWTTAMHCLLIAVSLSVSDFSASRTVPHVCLSFTASAFTSYVHRYVLCTSCACWCLTLSALHIVNILSI